MKREQVYWWQKPIAALGALSIAYHEVLRGRRTGVCTACGRLNHATSKYCLCGGAVEASDPPSDVLDDPTAGNEDSFEQPRYRFGIPALKLAIYTASILLLAHGIQSGSYAAGFTGFLLGAATTSLGGL